MNVKEEIFTILEHYIDNSDLETRDERLKLIEDLEMDAIDIVEFILELEEQFNIDGGIIENVSDDWKTIKDVIEFIEKEVDKNG